MFYIIKSGRADFAQQQRCFLHALADTDIVNIDIVNTDIVDTVGCC